MPRKPAKKPLNANAVEFQPSSSYAAKLLTTPKPGAAPAKAAAVAVAAPVQDPVRYSIAEMLKLKEERDEVIATRSEKLLPHLVSLHSGKSFFKGQAAREPNPRRQRTRKTRHDGVDGNAFDAARAKGSKTVTEANTLEDGTTLLREANAPWKGSTPADKQGDANALTGLLNKCSVTNFQRISTDLISSAIKHEDNIHKFVELIIVFAQRQSVFAELYAHLCGEVAFALEDGAPTTQFVTLLRVSCRDAFMKGPNFDDVEGLPEEDRTDAITRAKIDYKGLTVFIAQLYNKEMLPEKIFLSSVSHLLREFNTEAGPGEDNFMCVIMMLKTAGARLDQAAKTDPVTTYLRILRSVANEGKVPLRLKFEVDSLEALRANNWVDDRATGTKLEAVNFTPVATDGWETVSAPVSKRAQKKPHGKKGGNQHIEGGSFSASFAALDDDSSPTAVGGGSASQVPTGPPLSKDKFRQVSATLVEEYIVNGGSESAEATEEAVRSVRSELLRGVTTARAIGGLRSFVQAAFDKVCNRRTPEADMMQFAELLVTLHSEELMTGIVVFEGIKSVLEFFDDVKIDIPKLPSITFNFVGRLLLADCFDLAAMQAALDSDLKPLVESGSAALLLEGMIAHVAGADSERARSILDAGVIDCGKWTAGEDDGAALTDKLHKAL